MGVRCRCENQKVRDLTLISTKTEVPFFFSGGRVVQVSGALAQELVVPAKVVSEDGNIPLSEQTSVNICMEKRLEL